MTRQYDTVDFAMTGPLQPALTVFNAADGSRLEVLSASTGSFRVVTPGDPVPRYGRAHEVVYEPTLARQYFAQRAAQ